MKNENLVLTTSWEEVETDDYYLSEDWEKHTGEDLTEARKLQKENEL